jgi:hypothetical protein
VSFAFIVGVPKVTKAAEVSPASAATGTVIDPDVAPTAEATTMPCVP